MLRLDGREALASFRSTLTCSSRRASCCCYPVARAVRARAPCETLGLWCARAVARARICWLQLASYELLMRFCRARQAWLCSMYRESGDEA